MDRSDQTETRSSREKENDEELLGPFQVWDNLQGLERRARRSEHTYLAQGARKERGELAVSLMKDVVELVNDKNTSDEDEGYEVLVVDRDTSSLLEVLGAMAALVNEVGEEHLTRHITKLFVRELELADLSEDEILDRKVEFYEAVEFDVFSV